MSEEKKPIETTFTDEKEEKELKELPKPEGKVKRCFKWLWNHKLQIGLTIGSVGCAAAGGYGLGYRKGVKASSTPKLGYNEVSTDIPEEGQGYSE